MWSRPNQASLDAAASAAERGVRLAPRHAVHQFQSAVMNLPLVTSADGVPAGGNRKTVFPALSASFIT